MTHQKPRAFLVPPVSQATLRQDAPPDGRFLSRDACGTLAKRIAGMMVGGGHSTTLIDTVWTGLTRWARNQITVSNDTRNDTVRLWRNVRGAESGIEQVNDITDVSLEAAVRRAERKLQVHPETLNWARDVEYTEQHLNPVIWSDQTYLLDAEARAEIIATTVRSATKAGMIAAGFLEAAGQGRAVMGSRGRAMYYPYTEALLAITVRDPQGQGSGWAAGNHYDWAKLDAVGIAERALEKCLASRNPVALEPGRYTTILEPQAVNDFINPNGLFGEQGGGGKLNRYYAESFVEPQPRIGNPYWKSPGQSHLGDVIIDDRLSIRSDPMDPDLGVVPFYYDTVMGWGVEVYYPADWIKRGEVRNLAYDRQYGVSQLGKDTGLPATGSYRMVVHGPTTSMEEMIATTKRGLLVTRFDIAGYTRDGLWLIENGKMSKPVKNFVYSEPYPQLCLQSVRLEQVGEPVRVFSPGKPRVLPAMKIRDFNFIRMADAI